MNIAKEKRAYSLERFGGGITAAEGFVFPCLTPEPSTTCATSTQAGFPKGKKNGRGKPTSKHRTYAPLNYKKMKLGLSIN